MALVPLLSALAGAAHEDIQTFGVEWKLDQRVKYRVVATHASSTYESDTGTYASSKAVDGDLQTKWVSADDPTSESPQWLELELDSERDVAAVAVTGERPDNDGIVTARIQLSSGENGSLEFVDVASTDRLSSPSWMASFAPRRTNRVRLLITESGPPTSHTDVYEVLVLSRELESKELQAHLRTELQNTAVELEGLTSRIDELNESESVLATSLMLSINRLKTELHELDCKAEAAGFGGESQMAGLRARTEAIKENAQVVKGILSRSLPIMRDRCAQLQKTAQFQKSYGDDSVSTRIEGAKIVLVNQDVAVEVDQRTGAWNCTWLRPELAGLKNVGFKINVNDQLMSLTGSETEHSEFEDELGSGTEVTHRLPGKISIERRVRVYGTRPAVVVSARIANNTDQDIVLTDVALLDLSEIENGWWGVGNALESPGAVLVHGGSELVCDIPSLGEAARSYSSYGMCGFGFRDPIAGLVVGFLSAQHAEPNIKCVYKPGEGGSALRAGLSFYGRKLRAADSIELDPVYIAAGEDPFTALEKYADAIAAKSTMPPRTKSTALWCSWYAHRMSMSEDLVLANAEVVARYFKPLGLDIIQLDHGWQRGDVCGDWVVNERFPHGLKWLSNELHKRHGLKLGAWVSPVQLAESSQTFKNHPDWVLLDKQGKPAAVGHWYWEPKPQQYVLDATHPEAERYIERTFMNLSANGVKYFKIDFISTCSNPDYGRHDPYTARGWGVLRRAMEAIRRGAGPKAWIRYCQTPPLLSVGLADSAYGGEDTLDAGATTSIDTLRTNSRSMAASYWLHDRLYHREVCDMSVGMRAPLWEARMKLAMMVLGGTSVSFSDELTYLPPSRIRMMQQCLPAGGPVMRPLDLFEHTIPALWRIHCKTKADEWDVIGVFNFEDEPQTFQIDLKQLGFAESEQATVFEFWNERLVGIKEGSFDVRLSPRETQILIIRRTLDRPYIIATDMHALAGFHELADVGWNETDKTLSGRYRRAPEFQGKVYIHVPSPFQPKSTFPLNRQAAQLTKLGDQIWMHEVSFENSELIWSIPFNRSAEPQHGREPINF